MIGFVAPALRTAFTSVCIPATEKLTSLHGLALAAVLPFSQQDQLVVNGSLYRSKITEELPLKAVATELQNDGA